MLHLLTELLPPGRTSHYAGDDDLHVQLYLDDGRGPALVRVSVGQAAPYGDEPARGGTATVTITEAPGDCGLGTEVGAAWPDGTRVDVGVPTCLPFDGRQNRPTRAALTVDQAVRVATDPRWGVTMDAGLVTGAARYFPSVPVAVLG